MSTYKLNLWIDSNIADETTAAKYLEAIEKHNNSIKLWKSNPEISHVDAGFDLFVPVEEVIPSNSLGYKMNHMVKCSMNRSAYASGGDSSEKPVGYYLYPRSSTGTKTPLRLANSVGIIDSGYRGDLIAAFDNNSKKKYTVEEGQRVAKLCPPELTSPIYVIIVDSIDELGLTTRGDGGFGSTGV